MKLLMLSVINLCCILCRCGLSENILTFWLSPLYLVCMKVILLSVIKLGCKRCVGWKQLVNVFLLSVKMSFLRGFCCARKFLIPSVINIGCKRCIGWRREVKILLLSVKASYLCCVCCVGFVIEFDSVLRIRNLRYLGCVEHILSALLWFVKTIKSYKIRPGKYYYFLLPNNRSISRCAVFDNKRNVKMAGSKDNWVSRM